MNDDCSCHTPHQEVARLRGILATLGNLLGGPTMDYAPAVENRERATRIDKAVRLIARELAGHREQPA